MSNKAVVVYESMYGNTHCVAEAIGRGLGRAGEVTVLPVSKLGPETLDSADLVVVGGPTHAHSMSRASTRKAAVDDVQKHPGKFVLDPDCEGAGVREWLAGLAGAPAPKAAAFDTRFAGPALLTGRAARGIAKGLRRSGSAVVVKPESFFVGNGTVLRAGEEQRAEGWGRRLAELAYADAPRSDVSVTG